MPVVLLLLKRVIKIFRTAFSPGRGIKYFLLPGQFVFLFILLIPFGSFSQDKADDFLKEPTLQNIIQFALKKQPLIQQAVLDEEITGLQIKSKLSDWYPKINLNYLYQHNFLVPTSIIAGNPVKQGVNNTSAVQLTASQTIFNPDVLLAKQTKDKIKALARQQTTNDKIDLVAAVSKAFYDVLATGQQVKVSDQNMVRLELNLKDAQAQYKAGVVDKTDYKRATIALNNSKAAKKNNEEALKAKTAYLKALINYPETAALNIIYDSTLVEKETQLDTLQGVDYSKRIEYLILETQRKLKEADVKYNKWGYLPSLSANGAYNLNYLNNNFGKLYSQSYPNSYAGLTLTFPLFEGGKRKYNIQQAELELKQTDLSLENLKNQINSEYSAAMANYKSNLYNYLVIKENVALAEEVYTVIKLQYRSGIRTYLDVITAETDLQTAQINYFNAFYQVISSKIDVQKSKGEIRF